MYKKNSTKDTMIADGTASAVEVEPAVWFAFKRWFYFPVLLSLMFFIICQKQNSEKDNGQFQEAATDRSKVDLGPLSSSTGLNRRTLHELQQLNTGWWIFMPGVENLIPSVFNAMNPLVHVR